MQADIENAYKEDFDDSAWKTVRVPHDYAIDGPFSPENDKQIKEVVADGILTPQVHIARTGGLPITDHAWYRRKFEVSQNSKNIFVEFDGAMANSTVYVNGEKCGQRVYGYSSFSVDVTKACNIGENTLAVSLKPIGSNSRWYSGAGLYRNVRLIEKSEIYLPYCSTFVKPSIVNNKAIIDCTVDVENFSKEYTIEYIIKDASGKVVAKAQNTSSQKVNNHFFKLNGYVKWNVLDSYLYTLDVNLYLDGKLTDSNSEKFGIRKIEFNSEKGFLLNDRKVQLNGVCMHHDLGALGAAYNKAASRRQLEKLIAMGTNAIRTSHNPPAPEMLDLCDELGLLVLDEAFDEWTIAKVENGYSKHFDTCAKDDMISMVKRDRNHPSIIMWSIGNEILEQRQLDGWKIVKYLAEFCNHYDGSRPITAGLNDPISAFNVGFTDFIDVAGLNYKPHLYESFHTQHPKMPLYGSETASCVTSRGEYSLPDAIPYAKITKDNLQVDSYDLSGPPWACNPEREFFGQDRYDYIFGEFVWTGFDYLGEPTPYRVEWPSRSSYFGIYDLAGLEKDRVYSYMTKWTNKDVLHLFPHWNWNNGDIINVYAYSNYDEVELFINGKSMGISVKDPYDEVLRHRHTWKDVVFEEGEIKAVAVRNPKVTDVIKTSYTETSISLVPEKDVINADGDDVVYVQCDIKDENGTHCPLSSTKLSFAVTGAGEYLASDGGDATSTRVFSEPYCELFNGKCVVIIRSLENVKGDIVLTVKADNMQETSCVIKAC